MTKFEVGKEISNEELRRIAPYEFNFRKGIEKNISCKGGLEKILRIREQAAHETKLEEFVIDGKLLLTRNGEVHEIVGMQFPEEKYKDFFYGQRVVTTNEFKKFLEEVTGKISYKTVIINY